MERDVKWTILTAALGSVVGTIVARLWFRRNVATVVNTEDAAHIGRCPPWLLPADKYKEKNGSDPLLKERDALVAKLFGTLLDDANGETPFGATMRPFFCVDKDLTHLNHGGYGGCLQSCLQRRVQLLQRMESCPQQYEEHENLLLQGAALRELAEFVNAEPRNLVFVPNTTTGVSTVTASIPFVGHGDEVLHLQDGYLAVRNALELLCERRGARFVQVPLRMDENMSDSTVIDTVSRAITSRTRFAVIDHVLSINAAVLPIRELVKLFRSRGIAMMVDGAHAVGQLPVDLTELDPDFYVCSLHKWLCCTKGTAFLYIRPNMQHFMHPLSLSHAYKCGLTREFLWQGTNDYTPYHTLIEALRFRQRVGQKRAIQYMCELAHWAGEYLAQTWCTRLLLPEHMWPGAMRVVVLPNAEHYTANMTARLNELLRQEHRFVSYVRPESKVGLVVRISAALYNTQDDYRRFATAVVDAMAQVERELSADPQPIMN